jgi:site-specific DNA-methyltransferase (adenine-specific)
MEINKIYLSDCLEIMKDIKDKSIDMILCDLPYGMTACKWDTIIPLDPLWSNYKRIIKDNGVIVLTGSQPFTSMLVMSNPHWFKYEIIWEKDNCTNFHNAKKMVMKVHENILVFYKKRPIYNPQKFYKGIYRKVRHSSSYTAYGKVKEHAYESMDGMRYPRSVIKFNSEKGLHPTQKPVKLFEWLIKTYTNENDVVLDNCAGSGTTAIACLNTNRNYILIENNEEYFKIAQSRINNHEMQANIS